MEMYIEESGLTDGSSVYAVVFYEDGMAAKMNAIDEAGAEKIAQVLSEFAISGEIIPYKLQPAVKTAEKILQAVESTQQRKDRQHRNWPVIARQHSGTGAASPNVASVDLQKKPPTGAEAEKDIAAASPNVASGASSEKINPDQEH